VQCPVVKARHWTFGDANQLEQVFLNLFSNACDAMADCKTRELTVGVETVTRNGRGFLCCTVRDTGVGIPPDEQEKVFRAFHTKTARQGTGLGLSISRAILSSMAERSLSLLSSMKGRLSWCIFRFITRRGRSGAAGFPCPLTVRPVWRKSGERRPIVQVRDRQREGIAASFCGTSGD
jgi:signal transduction histidine kinase